MLQKKRALKISRIIIEKDTTIVVPEWLKQHTPVRASMSEDDRHLSDEDYVNRTSEQDEIVRSEIKIYLPLSLAFNKLLHSSNRTTSFGILPKLVNIYLPKRFHQVNDKD